MAKPSSELAIEEAMEELNQIIDNLLDATGKLLHEPQPQKTPLQQSQTKKDVCQGGPSKSSGSTATNCLPTDNPTKDTPQKQPQLPSSSRSNKKADQQPANRKRATEVPSKPQAATAIQKEAEEKSKTQPKTNTSRKSRGRRHRSRRSKAQAAPGKDAKKPGDKAESYETPSEATPKWETTSVSATSPALLASVSKTDRGDESKAPKRHRRRTEQSTTSTAGTSIANGKDKTNSNTSVTKAADCACGGIQISIVTKKGDMCCCCGKGNVSPPIELWVNRSKMAEKTF